MRRPGTSTARTLAATVVASAWIALVIGSGGCEIAVGDTVPAFGCVYGKADTCPANQVCTTQGQCEPSCASSCKAPSTCDTQTNACVTADSGMLADVVVADTAMTPDTAMNVDSGPAPDTGVPETGPTETSGPCRTVGCPCSGPAACDSNVCGDKESVSTGLYTAAGNANFCTKPCCTSSDCDAGSVCFATAVGGNYCVPPAWIGRAVADGTGLGGAACGTGRDCRSGVCGPGSVCADTCCSGQATGECAGATVCTFAAFPGTGIDVNYSANCAASPGNRGNGSSCSSDSTCASQICAADSMFGSNYCHGACRSSTDCGASYACSYVIPNMSTALVAACTQQGGSIAEGQTCNPAMDMCGAGFCDPTSKQCTSVCFTDPDCAGVAGWRCRPEQVTVSSGGSFSVLACGN